MEQTTEQIIQILKAGIKNAKFNIRQYSAKVEISYGSNKREWQAELSTEQTRLANLEIELWAAAQYASLQDN